MFDGHVSGQWPAQNFQGPNSININCDWGDCGQTFQSQDDWFSHFHRDHIDPELSFNCPIPTENCPQTIGSNPLHHLATAHGFDFDNIDPAGVSCPAPSCPPNLYCDPATLHNHFDQAHATLAEGGLHCQWNTCGTKVQDSNQLLAHLGEQHKVHVPGQGEEDIDLLAPLPIPQAVTRPPKPASESHLSCKWKTGPSTFCEAIMPTEDSLQEHVRTTHLNKLSKKTGYLCQWYNCGRAEIMGDKQGFSQRGKLERHMATHTGCEYLLSQSVPSD